MFYFLVRCNQIQLDQIWSRFLNRKFHFRFIGKKSNSRTFISSILLHSNFHTRAIIFHSLSFEAIFGSGEQGADRLPVSISGSGPAGNLKFSFFKLLPKIRLEVIFYFWPRTYRYKVIWNLKNPTWLSLAIASSLVLSAASFMARVLVALCCWVWIRIRLISRSTASWSRVRSELDT